MALGEDQQFCLRWNNFQANFTSQFETLRDDEDFTDVTIACEGQRLQAHKVVLSACSPFFKELFKTNPCSHPIIFMRDVEARHIVALMEFMYAGEVNVAQTHLSAFLKTAESLKIRGLTDTSNDSNTQKEDDSVFLNSESLKNSNKQKKPQISSSSTVTSSQDVRAPVSNKTVSSPPPKRPCKTESDPRRARQLKEELTNPFETFGDCKKLGGNQTMEPKMELPDYLSDDDGRGEDGGDNTDDNPGTMPNYYSPSDDLPGGMEIIPQTSSHALKDNNPEAAVHGLRFRRRKSSESWLPFDFSLQGVSMDDSIDGSSMMERKDGERRNRLIKLGEGIEIYEDQLRSVKWSDYRKLTRGLATILFSPAELATCSVTGQRWSRAGSGERPVKPALDRAKVQAIISYVATRFPMVEISRIKQVLAYKCKENSTAFKMKAVRYYG